MAIPAIELAVALLADFFGKEFTELQIREISRLIYDNFFWLDVVEFKIAIDRVKTQHYEKCYGHITPAYIMDVFQHVSAESLNARDNDSFNDYDRIRKEEENQRDFQKAIDQSRNDKIHQSAVSEFKEKILNQKPKTT